MMIGNSFSTSGDFCLENFSVFIHSIGFVSLFHYARWIMLTFYRDRRGRIRPIHVVSYRSEEYEWVKKPVWASKLIAGKSVKWEKQSCSQTRSFWGRRISFGTISERYRRYVEIVIISPSCRSCFSCAILQQCVHKFIKATLLKFEIWHSIPVVFGRPQPRR